MTSLTKKALQDIRALVQVNDHGNAYQLAAKTLGFDDLAEQLGSINRRHLALGHLPCDLYEQRYGLYKGLLTRAKAILSAGEYQQLYRSF